MCLAGLSLARTFIETVSNMVVSKLSSPLCSGVLPGLLTQRGIRGHLSVTSRCVPYVILQRTYAGPRIDAGTKMASEGVITEELLATVGPRPHPERGETSEALP